MKNYLILILFVTLNSCTTVNSVGSRNVADITHNNLNQSWVTSEQNADIINWAKSVQRNMPYTVAKNNGSKYYHGQYLENPSGSCAIHIDLPNFVSFGFRDDKAQSVPLYVDFDLETLVPIEVSRVGNKVEFRQLRAISKHDFNYYLSIDLDKNGRTLKVFGSRGDLKATCLFSEIPMS